MINLMNKNKPRTAGIYLVLFWIIYATDSLFVATNMNKTYLMISQYIVIAAGILLFLFTLIKRNGIIPMQILQTLGICMIFVLSMLSNRDFSGGYFLKIGLVLLSATIFDFISVDKFLYCYIKLMRVITIVSTFSFALGPILKNLSFIPTIVNSSGAAFKNLIFAVVPLSFTRNCGIFWEPGVFSIYLLFALTIVLFSAKPQIADIVIFSVGLISTLSTTGIACLALLFIAFMLEKKTKETMHAKNIIIIFLLALIVFVFISDTMFSAVFGKLGDGVESSSVKSRLLAIPCNLFITGQSPVFGVGISSFDKYTASYFAWSGYDSYRFFNTNTVLTHFSKFGIIVGLFYTFKLFKAFSSFSNNNLSKILLCLVAFLMLSGESMLNSLLFNIIIFLPIRNSHSDYKAVLNSNISAVKG